ncbi:hypothetical protein SDC9_129890 [bioreactor metagenome]|uniref:Uncharacterized protein n=1 Tax=bioreactor metagenome TaxID=1076179 RepID=A0A645D134_9ZZZZ
MVICLISTPASRAFFTHSAAVVCAPPFWGTAVKSKFPPLLPYSTAAWNSRSPLPQWVGNILFMGTSELFNMSYMGCRVFSLFPICTTTSPGLPLISPPIRASVASLANSLELRAELLWSDAAILTPITLLMRYISFMTLPVMVGDGYL